MKENILKLSEIIKKFKIYKPTTGKIQLDIMIDRDINLTISHTVQEVSK